MPDRPLLNRRSLVAPALIAVATLAACTPPRVPSPGPGPAGSPRELMRPPIDADSSASSMVAPGVAYHRLFRSQGPWTIHLLDVDRTQCWSPAALKADTAAVGRARVSALLERVRTMGDTVAAVNADFFLFSPPGVPTGAHIDDGRVITGPGVRPVLAIDEAGRIHMLPLEERGTVIARGDTVAITEWNRIPVTRVGVFDQRFGVRTDTSAGTLQVAVSREGEVLRIFTGRESASIPRGGWVVSAGRSAPAATRRWLASLRVGNTVRVSTSLAPLHPVDAVGGFPMLLEGGALSPALDAPNVQNLSKARHPRTAVGVARGGNRMLLVVVDGRRPGYSVGMTLPELAELMQELGATEAINLDGGGSTTMAVRGDGNVRVVNRPSDPQGERPVANALAVVKGCMRR